jgi:hypothetical protein
MLLLGIYHDEKIMGRAENNWGVILLFGFSSNN